jgi:CPA2 family monovalent cation:H+ antiporter-2
MLGELFLIELGGLVLLLAILARIASRFGFSPIPLYLLAGLAFGDGGVFPLVTAESFVQAGAEIGLILLLFSLGLQSNAGEFIETLRASGPAGATDLALTFVPAVAAGLALGWDPLAAILLGGVAYNTSSSVAARILEEMGWLGNRETPVALAVTVIEDLAMAAYLPVVTILLSNGDVSGVAVSVVLAVVAVGGALALGERHGLAIGRIVFSRSDEALLLTVLAVGVLVAGVAQRVGISAAVGGFLAGIVLSGPAAERAQELLRPLRDAFAAVFFVFFGFQIDPATIPATLPIAIGLAVVGGVGKYATGWYSARRAGIRVRGRRRAGILLIPRGEFSLAVAGLGVAAGIEPDFGPIATSYVLVSAISAPMLAVATRRLTAPQRAS